MKMDTSEHLKSEPTAAWSPYFEWLQEEITSNFL